MTKKRNEISSHLLRKKFFVFCKNKRAKYSLIIFLMLFILSMFAEFIANDKPLAVKYKNSWYFPIWNNYNEQTFGGDFPTPADYKDPLVVKNIISSVEICSTQTSGVTYCFFIIFCSSLLYYVSYAVDEGEGNGFAHDGCAV